VSVCLSLSLSLSVSPSLFLSLSSLSLSLSLSRSLWQVVTINAKLLGGNVSFFQNICLLGYCVAPLILATALCMVPHIHTYMSL
jgi:hypothetical protein